MKNVRDDYKISYTYKPSPICNADPIHCWKHFSKHNLYLEITCGDYFSSFLPKNVKNYLDYTN